MNEWSRLKDHSLPNWSSMQEKLVKTPPIVFRHLGVLSCFLIDETLFTAGTPAKISAMKRLVIRKALDMVKRSSSYTSSERYNRKYVPKVFSLSKLYILPFFLFQSTKMDPVALASASIRW